MTNSRMEVEGAVFGTMISIVTTHILGLLSKSTYLQLYIKFVGDL